MKSIYLIYFFIFLVLPVYCFDLKPDKSLNNRIEIVSRFSAGGRIMNPPVFGNNGKLYVFSEDSYFYIFKGGTLYKKVKLSSSPLLKVVPGKDGTLYGCFRDRTLRAYNGGGNLLWLKKLASVPVFPAIVNSSGNILVFLSDGRILSYALNGRLRWEKKVEFLSSTDPVPLNGNTIFLSSEGYNIISDRGIIKKIPFNVDNGIFFTASGNLFFAKEINDQIYLNNINNDNLQGKNIKKSHLVSLALMTKDFQPKWETIINGSILDCEVVTNKIYLLSSENNFCVLDLNGRMLSEKRINTSNDARLLVLDNSVLFAASGGTLKLFSHESAFLDSLSLPKEAVNGFDRGREADSYFPEPVFTGGKSAVLGGKDWILYFIKIPDTSSAGRSGLFSHNLFQDQEGSAKVKLSGNLQFISELSKSEQYENRKKSLSLIDEFIKDKGMSDYEYEILEILYRLGTDGTLHLNKADLNGGGSVIRGRAAELIYTAGTDKSYSMLRKMINAENDEYVIIKDMQLLGRAGSDPLSSTFIEIQDALERTNYNIRICYTAVAASENIASYNGYLPEKYSLMLLGMLDNQSDEKLKEKILHVLLKKRY